MPTMVGLLAIHLAPIPHPQHPHDDAAVPNVANAAPVAQSLSAQDSANAFSETMQMDAEADLIKQGGRFAGS